MFQQLALAGLVPVIKVDKAQDAVPLCAALQRGGLPVAEITFRTAAAEEAIRLVHEQLPDVLLGAGTVLTTAQADAAMKAGAGYLVAPGFNPVVVQHCLDKGYPILPGVSGPSDIEAALAMGLTAVKFFPAEPLGGVKLLKALLGPYRGIGFVPTGGISEANLKDYLSIPQVLACGGSWRVPDDAVKAQDWARIEQLARQAVQAVLGMELTHIGLNAQNPEQGMKDAQILSLITGWPILGNTKFNCFIGSGFEMMKQGGPGTNGHIALGTLSVPRAKWHMEKRGFTFDDSTAKYDANGKLRFIYLTDPVAGFGVHLIQK